MNSAINLAVILLLPIVPAYLLFKALKSTGSLTGVWHGLNLQLGGAFAGYFALVLLVVDTHNIWATPGMYVVRGQLVDDHGQPVNLSTIFLDPPPVKTLRDGEFTIYFAPVGGQAGDVQYPVIYVSRDEYEPISIPLDPKHPELLPKSLSVTRDGNAIDLHAVAMHRRISTGEYPGTGTLPQTSAAQEPK